MLEENAALRARVADLEAVADQRAEPAATAELDEASRKPQHAVHALPPLPKKSKRRG